MVVPCFLIQLIAFMLSSGGLVSYTVYLVHGGAMFFDPAECFHALFKMISQIIYLVHCGCQAF
jgi:hypothetical protein